MEDISAAQAAFVLPCSFMLSNLQLFLLALVLSIFNWLMTFLGSSLVYFVKSKSQKLVSIALGLAAGIMIAATFFSLLLPAIQQVEDHLLLLFLIPLVFFSGGLFLRLCDKFLPHEHIISHQKEGPTNTLSKNKLLLLAMTLHNIPEGLAVGIAIASVKTNLVPALILSIGIGIQNFPEGTAISLPLHESGISRFKAMMYGQYSALVEIPSALLGFLFAQLFSSILPFALSFAAGAMMFVCIEELIPEANALKEVDVGTMSFMVGFMIMMMLDVMFG